MTLHAIAPLLGLALLPGLVVGAALGLRGWTLAGAAPVLTFGVVGMAAPLVPHWSPVTFGAATLLVASVGLTARRLTSGWLPAEPPAAEERRHWFASQHAAVAGAVVVSGAVGLWVGWNATQGLTALPQEWDGFWHLNAITYIAGTGESAPGDLRALNDAPAGFFYPNGYHVLLATLTTLTGVAPTVAVNAGVTVLPGAFALGSVALVRSCGGRAALAAVTGLLTCAFTGFPYDVIAFGPLYPYTTGLVLLPGCLAVLATVLDRRVENPVGSPVALAVGAVGLLGVHPSVLIAAAVLGAALLVQRVVERRVGRAEAWTLAVAGVLTLLLAVPTVAATLTAAAGEAFDWPATSTPSAAVGALVTFSHGMPFPQYWLAALALVGVLRWRALTPMIWFVAGGAVFAVLFVMATAYEGPWVAALTKPWWNDGWRFAALWTLTAVVLAAAGAVAIADLFATALRRLAVRPRLAAAVAVVLVSGLVVAGTNGLYHDRNERRLAEMYSPARTVTPDELRTYEYLATVVPPGQLVMNDPYDGSPAMFATAGVRPLFASPTFELETMPADRRLLWTAFDTLGEDPAVRAAVGRLGVRYVVVGAGLVGRTDHIPGMSDLVGSPALQLVHSDGNARVYRITG